MLKTSVEDGILEITLDRPDAMNALNPEVVQGIIAALEEGAERNDVRVAIFTGAGSLFTSGMDVNVFKNHREPENQILLNYRVREMFDTFIRFPKPLIGAANGLGVGFGLTVLALMDIVVMAESARFMIPFTNLGVGPEACSSYLLPKVLGHQKANWLLMSGEWITAQECLEAGIALQLVPDQDLMTEARRRAAILASKSLTAVMATKEVLMAPHREALFEANRLEMERFAQLLESDACKEGMDAFFGKRAPQFKERGL